MTKKFVVKYVHCARENQTRDERACVLEDTLNDLSTKGYKVRYEDVGEGFMFYGKLRKPKTPKQRNPVLQGLIDVVLQNRQQPASPASGFLAAVMQELTEFSKEGAKKEIPSIVTKLVKGTPIDDIRQLAEDCKEHGKQHLEECKNPELCPIVDICTIASTSLQSTAEANLS